ncbi:MAG TPA: 1-deoxy-D-xylulose-5-phosphate synthase [Clostridiales bacterium]|nr:1-deoxy-D-xylulose-5-phosphate synthase [Clostridiales bacterium]
MSNYSLLDSINSPSDLKRLTIGELYQLSDEIREFIIKNISNTGGHLASNLGVVELTLALHYVFNSPFDKIIWDVGHQSYVHKIITKRKDMFCTIRQYGGLSGFPKRKESIHDIFETGHSSTSISAALGIARARDLKGEDGNVIAVIGDGALTGGMAFEGLNDAGHTNTKLMVVLNDNEMSISENVGALSRHLSKIRSSSQYNRLKREIEYILKKTPVIGNPMAYGAERLKNSFKYIFLPGVLFEELGFTYIGPIDGHNIIDLIEVFNIASRVAGPTLVHIVTKKGKGYEYAEKYPESYHGISSFNVKTGRPLKQKVDNYSHVFGTKLVEMAKKDERIVAVCAAMPDGTGLSQFEESFPNRFFDVGIAEQHAVTMAAGLAISGMRPYVAIYSTFLQRAYDQILHDVCIQNLPVVFCIDRAGLVGQDGETHQGVFDITYLRTMPNMTIMAPKDVAELKKMLDYSIHVKGPLAIRYPRGYESCLGEQKGAKIPSWEILHDGKDCAILAVGRMVSTALEVRKILKSFGIEVAVVNARTVKPLDSKMLFSLYKKYKLWITLEDNIIAGGFGSSINEFLNAKNLDLKIKNYGIPDRFISHGSVDILFKELGLDGKSLAWEIKDIIDQNKERTNARY